MILEQLLLLYQTLPLLSLGLKESLNLKVFGGE
jgi:hypothetical protein